MNTASVICVVEGHGEVEAAPILVRRIAEQTGLGPVRALRSIRVPKGKMVKPEELTRAIRLASDKLSGVGAILILLDSDGACPAELGPRLAVIAGAHRPGLPVAVVVAHQEFEAWYLAAARSLAGRRGLAIQLDPPGSPEAIRGAKGWLSARMPSGRPYAETLDQPAFAAVMDLDAARSAPSFDKLYRDVTRLLMTCSRGPG